jgi:uncharacterized phage protein (TIGR02216 family)
MSSEGKRFPWARMMELGLGVLRLPPEAFWRTTPREIAAAFPPHRNTAPDRSELEELMQRFPDAT